MPRYYEDKPEGGACAGVKEDLGTCLLQSDCVLQVARPAGRVHCCGRGSGRRGRGGVPGRLRWRSGRETQWLVLGADYSSDLINLDVSTVGASVPSGFKLELTTPPRWISVTVKPFRLKKRLLNAVTLLGSECLFRLQRAIVCNWRYNCCYFKEKRTVSKWT